MTYEKQIESQNIKLSEKLTNVTEDNIRLKEKLRLAGKIITIYEPKWYATMDRPSEKKITDKDKKHSYSCSICDYAVITYNEDKKVWQVTGSLFALPIGTNYKSLHLAKKEVESIYKTIYASQLWQEKEININE